MIDRSARGEDYLGELCSKYCGLYNHLDCDNCKNMNKYTHQILEESDRLVMYDINTIEEIATIVETGKQNQSFANAIGRYLLESGNEIEVENDEFAKICEDLANLTLDRIKTDVENFLQEVVAEKDYQTNRLCATRATRDMCKNCEAECNFRKADNKEIEQLEDKAHQFENDCYESANRQKNKFACGYGVMLTDDDNNVPVKINDKSEVTDIG